MRAANISTPPRSAALWRPRARRSRARRRERRRLGAFLAAHDSRWRHVGRVHLHLAENRKDAERPFAFLATYAPGLAAHGEVRHAPLGAALREYAGAGAKAEL